ncbi:unnamed protein product [Prunus armeniaca]|uniref:Uncharacterized protein n=1 Tax=Prunus armeniaca TaxID=36596 RepID=A0A6J5XJD3_PRUAR|nr:unnamed protein product [Prunus armeniaca]CAB4312092.1 unnamed protein product [Prunus armeniaca]
MKKSTGKFKCMHCRVIENSSPWRQASGAGMLDRRVIALLFYIFYGLGDQWVIRPPPSIAVAILF